MKRLLIPVVVVVALAAALFLWDLPRERRGVQVEEEGLRLTTLDPELVDTLRVVRSPDRLEVVRDSGDWWLTQPVTERAEDSSVRGILSALCRATAERVVATGVDTTALDAYGLGGLRAPTDWIEMRSANGAVVTYDLGRSNPTGSAIYLRVRGRDEVMLVNIGLGELGRTSYQALRIYDLFDIETEDVDWMQLRNDQGQLTVRRNERGLWFTDDAQRRQVQRRVVHHLAYDLAHARVRRYVADDLDEGAFVAYGLDDPALDMNFEAQSRRYRLRVGNESEEPHLHFARRDSQSTALIVSGELISAMELQLDGVYEANPVPDNYALLDSVRVVWHTGETVTAIPGYRGEWDIVPPPGWQGEPEHFLITAQNLITGLEELQSDQTVELSNASQRADYLQQSRVSCELYWPDRSVIYDLGWRRGEDAHWVHVRGEDRVYRIRRDLYFRLRAALLSADLIDGNS